VLVAGAGDALLSKANGAFIFLSALAGFLGFHLVLQCGAATAAIRLAVRRISAGERSPIAEAKALRPLPAVREPVP
jgi:hypothetical protein